MKRIEQSFAIGFILFLVGLLLLGRLTAIRRSGTDVTPKWIPVVRFHTTDATFSVGTVSNAAIAVENGETAEPEQIWTRVEIKQPEPHVTRSVWRFRDWQEPTPDGRHQPGSQQAYNYGAQSKMTLRIVDLSGNPIPDVEIEAYPCFNWSHKDGRKFRTDKSGTIILEDRKADHYNVFARKEGYYQSFVEFHFFSENHVCVENGKWIPWNPHVELVLKPIGEYVSLDWLKSWNRLGNIPVERDLPFDFLAFDFLPPFGTGKQTNAIVKIEGTYDPDKGMHSVATLSFPFGGGFRKEPVDGFCDFLFPREIAEGDFSSTLVVKRDSDRQSGVRLVGGLIPCKEFFAMKIPIVDPIGITNYIYGVALEGPIASISGDETGTGTLYLECYLNPEPGNRVVESKELLMRQSW